MDDFEYRAGQLWCEQVSATEIAEQYGTPVYVYSADTARQHYQRFVAAFAALDPLICYSIKSCQNLSLCRLLNDLGAGFDVVSGGELQRALLAGAEPCNVVFAGVGKSDPEIQAALNAGIGWFNVESEAEMENLTRLAAAQDCTARVALRVNPDVDPQTHRYTTTGRRETKFGVDLERARRFFEQYCGVDGVALEGIHLHLGSPVNRVQPYVDAVQRALDLIDALQADGHVVRMLNLGGGYGAHYESDEAPPATAYADALVPLLRDRGLQIVLEPGRAIMANAGVLLTRISYLKVSGKKHFVIVDAGMNDLIRPVLYEAYHFAWPVAVEPAFVPTGRGAQTMSGTVAADVVGPICESGDFLAVDRRIPPVQRGDLMAIFSTGAYGFVMSSQYNSRPRPPEVLIDGKSHRLIRRRETVDDLLRCEVELLQDA
jgi:diaminopimelate decarboxylase